MMKLEPAMYKNALLLLFFSTVFCLNIKTYGQGNLSYGDIEEIKNKATNKVEYFERLLNDLGDKRYFRKAAENMITNSLDVNRASRPFLDGDILIENDLNPNGQDLNKVKRIKISRYLNDFLLSYNEREKIEPTPEAPLVKFQIENISEPLLKEGDNEVYFVTVTFTKMLSAFHFDYPGIAYKPIKRTVTLHAVFKNLSWDVRIAGIEFFEEKLPSLSFQSFENDNIEANKAITLSWESRNYNGEVDLELWKGGERLKQISTNLSGTEYDWIPDKTLEPANDYQLKLKASNLVNLEALSEPFAIKVKPSLSFLNVPQEISPGNSYLVTWEKQNYKGQVRVELWKEDNRASILFQDSVDNSFQWTVAENIDPDRQYSLKLSATSAENLMVEKKLNVSAVKPSISFNAMDKVAKRGKPFAFSWEAIGIPSSVNVELWRNGAKFQALSENFSDDTFVWTPSNALPVGSGYEIKLMTNTDKPISVISQPFSLKRKIPLGLKVGTGVAAAVPIAILLLIDQDPTVDEQLPDPPEIE